MKITLNIKDKDLKPYLQGHTIAEVKKLLEANQTDVILCYLADDEVWYNYDLDEDER